MTQEPHYIHLATRGMIATKRQKARRTVVLVAGSWNALIGWHARLGPQVVRTLLALCQRPSGGMH